MALDLNIQIFAYHCFSKRWAEHDMEKIKMETLLIYGDECTKDKYYTEAWDEAFCKAINCRFFFFQELYADEIDFAEVLQFDSMSDCYDFANFFLNSEYLFGDLNVFEKMFATCALVHYLISGIHKRIKVDILTYGNLIWAMYFDKFAEEFYKEGGWKELKRVAKTYDPLFNFICLYPKEKITLTLWKEALENYHQFQNTVKLNCCKQDKIHVSLLWIRFQTEHFEEHVTVSSSYAGSAKTSDIEQLLQDLKLVLNFHAEDEKSYDLNILKDKFERNIYPTGMQNSKTLDSSKEIENNNDLRVQDQRMYEELFNKNLNAKSNFKTQHQSENFVSVKKVGHKIMDRIETFETVSPGTRTLKKRREVNLDEYSDSVYDNVSDRIERTRFKTDDLRSNRDVASIAFDGDKILDGIVLRNAEKLSGAQDVLSTNQNEELKWPKHISSQEVVPSPRDCYSENEISRNDQEEIGYSLSALKSNFYSKTKDTPNKNTEFICSSSANEAAALSEKNEISEKNLCSTENCLVVNKVTKTSDGNLSTEMELDKLRKEQKDIERSFLRMLLLLGDRQGIKNVLETLPSNEGDKTNSTKKLNKKNRSKRKSRR